MEEQPTMNNQLIPDGQLAMKVQPAIEGQFAMEDQPALEGQFAVEDQPMQPIYMMAIDSMRDRFLSEGSANFKDDTRSRMKLFKCERRAAEKQAETNFPECELLQCYYLEMVLWEALWPGEEGVRNIPDLNEIIIDLLKARTNVADAFTQTTTADTSLDSTSPDFKQPHQSDNETQTDSADITTAVEILRLNEPPATLVSTLGQIQPVLPQNPRVPPMHVVNREVKILKDAIMGSLKARDQHAQPPQWGPNGSPIGSVRLLADNFKEAYTGRSVYGNFTPKRHLEKTCWRDVLCTRDAEVMNGYRRVHYLWIEFGPKFEYLGYQEDWMEALEELSEEFLLFLRNEQFERRIAGRMKFHMHAVDQAWVKLGIAREGQPALKFVELLDRLQR